MVAETEVSAVVDSKVEIEVSAAVDSVVETEVSAAVDSRVETEDSAAVSLLNKIFYAEKFKLQDVSIYSLQV